VSVRVWLILRSHARLRRTSVMELQMGSEEFSQFLWVCLEDLLCVQRNDLLEADADDVRSAGDLEGIH
jgi:hypothetical protein